MLPSNWDKLLIVGILNNIFEMTARQVSLHGRNGLSKINIDRYIKEKMI